MSHTVWLCAATLTYPDGGGHLWVYLNWALGLKSAGCNVVWLEPCDPHLPVDRVQNYVASLKNRLEPYGLADSVAVCSSTSGDLPTAAAKGCLDLEAVDTADLLLNMAYGACAHLMPRFRRTALIDIDPGLLQIWLAEGKMRIPAHDLYFTTGENIATEQGRKWEPIAPCVALDWWPVWPTPSGASFSTVAHWDTRSWLRHEGKVFQNDKKNGFQPFLDLPRLTTQPLELALCLTDDEQPEREGLEQKGWRVRHAFEVTSTPADYQQYIQNSKGEFSCAKPSCVRLQKGWISDRTICYLASGKPAVVQHTGPRQGLPDAAGLFRFYNLDDAVRFLETIASDYERQSRLARAMAEEFFDARKIATRVLQQVL